MLAVHDSGRYQCVAVAVWSATFAANVGAIFYGRWLLVKVGQASGLSADGFAGWLAAYLIGVISIAAPLCVLGCACQYVSRCVAGVRSRRDTVGVAASATALDRPTISFAPISPSVALVDEVASASDANTTVAIVSPPGGPRIYGLVVHVAVAAAATSSVCDSPTGPHLGRDSVLR